MSIPASPFGGPFDGPFDGPRLLRREEGPASDRLFRIAFDVPLLTSEQEQALPPYDQPRRGGVYVLAHDGQLVSQLLVAHDQLRIHDAVTRVASIGGVGTHPDYRNRRLAGRLLEYAAGQMVREGARVQLISGARSLYTYLGNVPQGRYHRFSIRPATDEVRPAAAAGELRPAVAAGELRPVTSADAPLLARLYHAEPVHYVRRHAAFADVLAHPGQDSYLHVDARIVERGGEPVAYLFLGCPYGVEPDAGIRYVSEYAGSRVALAGALERLCASGDVQELTVPVPWQDFELIQVLEERAYRSTLGPLEGHTLRIVDFPGLMRDLRPLLRARLGANLLRGLRFEQSGPLLGGTGADRYAIVRGRERLELDGAGMTRLVMGSAAREPEPVAPAGALAEILPALFPLPSFLPGLNYR